MCRGLVTDRGVGGRNVLGDCEVFVSGVAMIADHDATAAVDQEGVQGWGLRLVQHRSTLDSPIDFGFVRWHWRDWDRVAGLL